MSSGKSRAVQSSDGKLVGSDAICQNSNILRGGIPNLRNFKKQLRGLWVSQNAVQNNLTELLM